MPRTLLVLATAFIIALPLGCKDDSRNKPAPAPQESSTGAAAAAEPADPEVNAWLLETARSHKLQAEQARDWVTFKGTNVAMSASVLGGYEAESKKPDETVILQVNFRLRLPGGQVVVQPVVGWGRGRDGAIANAEASFLLGSFHAFLGAFIDPGEEHVQQEERTIGGRRRIVTQGGVVTKTLGGAGPATRESGGDSTPPEEDKRWRDQFLRELDAADLPAGTHWIDVYHGSIDDKQEMEIQLDNQRWTEMEDKMRTAPWPRAGRFTSVRQFLVIQDPDDPTRPKRKSTTRNSIDGSIPN